MTDDSTLSMDVEKLHGVPVLVVGDVMLDRFVSGAVERISPEAPIPVVRITRETEMLGGAGNVIANVQSLGANPLFVSVVGDDAAGRELVSLVERKGIGAEGLVVEAGRRTTLKTRFFGASQQLLRADRESDGAIGADTAALVLAKVATALDDAKVMVLSDYGKGVLTPETVRKLIAMGREAGIPVIVDPKGTDYARYEGASLVTPNKRELSEAAGRTVDGDDEVVSAARSLIEACGIEAVLATRSQDGMTLVRGDGAAAHLPAEAREVFDVSGAGDTVVATLAAAVGAGVPMIEAARLANTAAGIVVGKVGTAVVHAQDLIHALHREEFAHSESKVLGLDEAMERVETWRRRGRKVGFTNGCFDLLHPGHVSLLRQARQACDRLVVGLNSDDSVKRLKGEGRPVQSESSRATVLASLETVDAVVIFHEDTPLALIDALGPDVLVKGADYTVETVVGAKEVQARGGRVVLAQLEDGHSTTGTIGRMTKGEG